MVGRIYRLVFVGVDINVRIWKVEKGLDGKVIVEFLFNFVCYIKVVNVVCFFLIGEILVLGGDDVVILLWKVNDNKELE